MTKSVFFREPEALSLHVLTKTIVVLLFSLQNLLSLNQIFFFRDHITLLPEQGVLSSLQYLHLAFKQRDNTIALCFIFPVLYLELPLPPTQTIVGPTHPIQICVTRGITNQSLLTFLFGLGAGNL